MSHRLSHRQYMDSMSAELAEAGDRFQAARGDEPARHAGAVALLRVRLRYFTARDTGMYRGPELDELCAKLTSAEVRALTDLCWASYLGALEYAREDPQ